MFNFASPAPTVTTSRHGWSALLLAALFASLFSSPLFAAHPYAKWAEELGIDLNLSYDGTRVMEFQGGTFEALERRAPGKMLNEIQMGNMASGVILREDLGKSYLLMPSMGFYKEETLEGGLMQTSNGLKFSEIEKVGEEEVIGFPSNKFKTKFEDNEGKGAGFVWVTHSGVPIKMDMIYSSRGEKGQRITMQFTELNLREQDPAHFEVPANLKPMTMGNLGSLGQMGNPAAPAPAAAPATQASGNTDLASAQQRCLEEAAAAAEAERESQKKKRAFGRLVGAVARTASRFGNSDIARASHDVYSANASAQDVSAAARDLGITEDQVEKCRNP